MSVLRFVVFLHWFQEVKCYIIEDCAILCKNKDNCRSFLYHQENRFCRGFDDVFLTAGPSVQSPGAVYFVMNKVCPPPPVYSRASLNTTGHTAGSVVTYTCHVGYSPYSTAITCNPDGTWSNIDMLCQDCISWGSDFNRIPDVRIDPSYKKPGLYTVKMKAGMSLDDCKNDCLGEDSCKVFYFGLENKRSACYKYTERIYDDPQLLDNYISDVMFDAYIRTCLM